MCDNLHPLLLLSGGETDTGTYATDSIQSLMVAIVRGLTYVTAICDPSISFAQIMWSVVLESTLEASPALLLDVSCNLPPKSYSHLALTFGIALSGENVLPKVCVSDIYN